MTKRTRIRRTPEEKIAALEAEIEATRARAAAAQDPATKFRVDVGTKVRKGLSEADYDDDQRLAALAFLATLGHENLPKS